MTKAAAGARRDLALVLVAYGVARLLHLFLSAPHDLLVQGWEELGRGAIGQGLRDGLEIPFADYRADDYSGGSLVVGGLASLAFRLLGPSLFALKMVPLAFSATTLACWYVVARAQWGEPAARAFAWVFIVSPPLWTTFSVTAMGFHSESAAFTALTVLLVFRLRDGRGGAGTWAALGFVAGSGLWFVYTYALTLAALGLFWVAFRVARPRAPHLALAGACFLVGFLPWFIVGSWSGHAGLVLTQRPFWTYFDVARLWSFDLRTSGPYALLAAYAPDNGLVLERRLTNLGYTLVLVLPVGCWLVARALRGGRALLRERAGLLAFVLLYLAVFVAAVQASEFDETRYRVVALPFLFAAWARVVSALQAGPAVWRRRTGTALLVSAVLGGVAANAALFPPRPSLYVLRARGYSYGWIPLLLSQNQPDGWLERSVALSRRMEPRDRHAVERSVALVSASVVPLRLPRDEVAQVIAQLPPSAVRYFLFCLGAWVGSPAGHLRPAVATVAALDPRERADALEGVFREWSETLPARVAPATLAPPAWLPAEAADLHWRGVGRHAVRHWTAESASFPDALGEGWLQSSPQRGRILEGVGEAIVGQWRFGPGNGLLPPRRLPRVHHALRGDLLRGLGRGLGEFTLCDETEWMEAQLEPALEAADRAPLEAGRAETVALARSCY